MKRDFDTYLQKYFSTFLDDHAELGENSILILKDFTSAMIESISKEAKKCGCFVCIPDLQPLTFSSLNKYSKSLLTKIMSQDSEKPILAIYEQYQIISDMLNSKFKITDKNIFIIENNIFNNASPSLLSIEATRMLYEYFQKDDYAISDVIMPYIDIYSDVFYIGQNQFTVNINKHSDSHILSLKFFRAGKYGVTPFDKDKTYVEVLSTDFWETVINLFDNKDIGKANFILDEKTTDSEVLHTLVPVLNDMNIDFVISQHDEFDSLNDGQISFSSLLKRMHGDEAKFRNLQFYKHPDISNEIIEISQETIISYITLQSEQSLKGNRKFKNIFITAPTGAGKSLLFQLPAIYLAEKYDAVTIVVSPLVALMKDQVENLIEKGINSATFLNSTISFEEREHRSAQIKNGEKSIVYLAPELLLSCPLNSLLGERKLALFVVDEAHTVTSWGRDFRVDYWFLGNYIKNAQRNGYLFPVLCLTATAVYGGIEDVVNETLATLGLHNNRILLGNVKRNNIDFDVRHFEKGEKKGSYEQLKLEKTVQEIEEYVKKNKKTLIYCPYTVQVNELYRRISPQYIAKVGIYHGQLNNIQKEIYQDDFRNGKITVMICTKAYGMGIDVKDITNCYHFAPSGNLADYIQEIGRIARNKEQLGIASIDFSSSDMKYARVLHGISGLKQYQLKEMLRKLYDIYSVKNHRNLLIAPDVFEYLFNDIDISNKVKNGLLLLSKDLENKYGFPVITVRPKNMFTKNYVCVSSNIESEFLQKYGDIVKQLADTEGRIIKNRNPDKPDTIVKNDGHIYEIDMSTIWEREFSDLTFADFKRKFFDGTLFSDGKQKQFWPRMKISVNYKKEFRDVYDIVSNTLDVLTDVFSDLKAANSNFSFIDFKNAIKEKKDSVSLTVNDEFLRILLEMFVVSVQSGPAFNKKRDPWTFIQKKNTARMEVEYRVIGNNHLYIKNKLLSLLCQYKPNREQTRYISYIPPQYKTDKPELTKLLTLLEILDISSYEIRGGSNTEVFVRISDPMKLRYLLQGKYSNGILKEIEEKHRYSFKVVNNFFSTPLTSDDRWDIIENYFLGNDEYTKTVLNIAED